MTDRSQHRLRELLLELKSNRSLAAVEQRVPGLVEVRFTAEEAALSEATQARHLEAIRLRVLERSGGVPHWFPRLFIGPRRQLLWPVGAVVVLAVLVVFILLNMPGRSGNRYEAHGSGQPKSGPRRPAPENRIVPPPKERVVEHSKPTPKPNERPDIQREPHKNPNKGLLAHRVEVGTFSSVIGEPKVIYLDLNVGLKALPKMPVTTAMRIETGDADKAEIRFADGSTIALGFNTTITVPHVQGVQGAKPITASEVSVTAGSISASIADSEARGLFAVHTPVATAEVLGTEFSLALKRLTQTKGKAKLSAVLQVREGRVAFYNDLGRVVAGASMESTATEGSAPTEPRRLVTLKLFRTDEGIPVFSQHTSRLGAPDAAYQFVYPLGTAGLEVVTLPQGQVRIVEVALRLPASKAGVKVGDVVVAINGSPIRSAESVRRAISRRPGARIELTIHRKGERLTIQFTTVLARRGPTTLPPRLAARLYAATWPAIAGDEGKSLQMLQLLAREGPSAAVFNNLGVLYEMRDQMGLAIRNYQAAVRLDPNCSLYHYSLGGALKNIGNLERSAEEFGIAVQCDRRSSRAAIELSETLHLLDRRDDALAVLEEAPVELRRFPAYWKAKARLMWAWGRLDEARDAIAKAIDIAPDDSKAHSELGSILVDLGRLAEAEASYRKSLDLNPLGGGHVHNNLGLLLFKLGRLEDAEAIWRRAIALEPEHACSYNQLGVHLMDIGRSEEAEAMYRKSLELDPKLSLAYNNLGALQKGKGNNKEAEAMYRKALALDPNFAIAFANLGSLLRSTGRVLEAETAYRKAIAADPQFLGGYSGLGRLLRDAGRNQEAEAVVRQAVALVPKDAASYRSLARLFKDLGRTQEAEATLRQAIERDPRDPESYNSLGIFLEEAGCISEAEALFRKAIEVDPKHVPTYNNLGNLLKRTGRIREAEATYRKAIELAPRKGLLYYNLGLLLNGTGRGREAEAMYRKAIELDPKHAEAYTNLGFILRGRGQVQEAEALYRKAIETDPKLAAAYSSLGDLLQATGRVQEAEAMFRKTIEVDPSSENSYYNRAQILEQQGRLDEAEETFRAWVKAAPKSLRALGWLAWFLADHNRKLDDALDFVNRVLAVTPNDPNTLDTLGWTYYRRQEFEKAEATFRRALELYTPAPDVADVWVHLGLTYERLNKKEQAVEAYRQALKLQPGHKGATEALKRLGG